MLGFPGASYKCSATGRNTRLTRVVRGRGDNTLPDVLSANVVKVLILGQLRSGRKVRLITLTPPMSVIALNLQLLRWQYETFGIS